MDGTVIFELGRLMLPRKGGERMICAPESVGNQYTVLPGLLLILSDSLVFFTCMSVGQKGLMKQCLKMYEL